MATQGKYAVVDTTLSITDATVIKELNGRQGDNGRVVYFALKDGRLPHNLNGQDVKLSVKDAAGKVKVLAGIYDLISATAGLFSMLIPAEFYQAAGDVEEAYLAVFDDKNTTISSIPISFTVFPNGIILSANASKDYINTVNKITADFNQQIKQLNNNVSATRSAYKSLDDALKTYTKLVNDNYVAQLNKKNEFTKDVKIDANLNVTGAIDGQIARSTLPYKRNVAIDLNKLPDTSEVGTYSAFYFSTPTSVKHTPESLSAGLVETFILHNVTILQRFTQVSKTANQVWHRVITNWNDGSTPKYLPWTSERDVHVKSIKAFGGNLTFVRSGNTVSVSADIENTNFRFPDFHAVYSAGKIPAGYRPAIDYPGIVMETPTWLKGGNRNRGALEFGSSGFIGARSASVKDDIKSWVTISGSYVTNDSMPE